MLLQSNRPASSQTLRWFAGVFFPLFCAGVGAYARRHDASVIAVAVWAAGGMIAIAGLIRPSLIRPVYTTLNRATYPLGWVLSYALLLTIYFAIITPVGWVLRRFHDPMDRRFDPDASSYWTPRAAVNADRYF